MLTKVCIAANMPPPIIMDEEVAAKGMDIVDEAIWETERELGYA